MKKVFKRIISLLLAAVLVFGSVPLSGFVGLEIPKLGGLKKIAFSVSEFFDGFTTKASAATSGTCGENLTWEFDETTGELVIDGTGEMFDYNGNGAFPWFKNGSKIKAVSIHEGVTSISSSAFSNSCRGLVSVSIPFSIKIIGEYAFWGCPELSVVYYPGTYEQWKNVFVSDGNNDLTNNIIFEFNSENPYYGSGVCGKNLTWKLYTDGELVVDGTGDMFDYETWGINRAPWSDKVLKIKRITINDGATSIGDCAFYEYEHLESVTIANSVVKIGDYAFRDCTSLSEIKMSNNITEIGMQVFNSTAYYNDRGNWENGFLYLENCLIECNLMPKDGVTEIKLKEGTSVLGGGAFSPHSFIDSILVKEKIRIVLPESVRNVGSAFYLSFQIDKIIVDEDNPYYNSVDGVLFNKNMTEIVQYPSGKKEENYIVPSSVNKIGDYAFLGANIYNVYLGENVKTIGSYVFCDALEFPGVSRVYISDSVNNISPTAFIVGDMDSFLNLAVVCSKNSFAYEFASDKGIPVADVECEETFSGDCGENMTWEVDAKTRTLTIEGTGVMSEPELNDDLPTMPWHQYKEYIDKVVIKEGVESTCSEPFSFMAVKSYELPESLRGLGTIRGNSAFFTIDFPSNLTAFGGFDFCVNLGSVEYPESLEYLGYYDVVFIDEIELGSNTLRFGEAYFNTLSITEGLTEFNINVEQVLYINNLIIPESLSDINITVLEDEYGRYTIKKVYCYENTYGHQFAIENNIPFEFIKNESLIGSVEISGNLPVISGNTLTFTVTTSTDITKLQMEDNGYVVNEWTGSEYYTDNDDVRTWTVTQIINTIGENRCVDFRAGNAGGYEEGTYQSPIFTCIENEQKLSATTIEHPLSSGAFLQGDEQNLIWTVDGVPGDGVVPDYFIINVFKDNKLVFAERNLIAVDYLGNDGKFFYDIDGDYFKEAGEYEISVTSIKKGYQYSDDEVVISIYPSDLYIEGFNSEIEMVNVGESYYFSGKIIGATENISVVIQTPVESLSHEYFSQTKLVQEFDLSTLYPITFGSGEYGKSGEYYIKIFARPVGKGEETLVAQKRVVLLENGVKQLDKPVITSSVVTKSGESYKITWDAVENADYYTVIVSELGIRKTGIENKYFELSDKTFKSAGEYTILVYAHSYSDEYVTSNNSIKLTVTKQDIGCSVISARIIGETTIKAGYSLKFEVITTQNATKLKLMDKNYVVSEWTDSSNYVDKDGKRYWNVTELIKTVGVNRKLQFYAGNSLGYSDIYAEVTFTCNENPNKLGNTTITSPVNGYSYDQNNLQYLVWDYDSEILPDYYIVEVFTNSQTKKYLNKNVDGNLLWIEIPAEYFENTGTYTISITAVKEFYQTSSASVTFISKCTHMHTEKSEPTLIKGSYKILSDSQHSYQTQTIEVCNNCGVTVNKSIETHTKDHTMHEGLLCVCGHYKAQSGFSALSGLHLQSNKNEQTYLDASTTLDYWGSVSPSDSGYISMLGKVTKNGVEYAFIRYPLNNGGYKCGFIRSELVGKIPFNQPTATVNGVAVNIVYDANGYVYADAKQLFDVLGGSSNTETLNTSGWIFKASAGFFHNSYEYGAYETGFIDSVFNSATSIQWISSGDKKVIENGKYYDIEYYLYGEIENKRVLGGNQKFYTANNSVYFPLSVLTSDICRYDEVSTLTYTYNAKWYTSDEFVISENDFLNDYFDALYVGEIGCYRVNSQPFDNNVVFELGENVFAEVKGFSCKVSYGERYGYDEIYLTPANTGTGTINIYYVQNEKETIIFSKSLHCFDSSTIRGTFDYGTNETQSDKVYTFANGLHVTNLMVEKTGKGVNVSFDAYNSNVNCFVVQSHDKNGNDIDTFNSKGEQVGFKIINGFYLKGGATTGAVQGVIKTINVLKNTKHQIENAHNEYQYTQVSVWVPIDGYLTIDDSRNSDIALVYDTLMVGYAENDAVCTAIDSVFSLKLSTVNYSKNSIVDYIVSGGVDAGTSALLLDELRKEMGASSSDSNEIVEISKTFLESFVIGPLSTLHPVAVLGDIGSKMLCCWSNIHNLTKSLKRNTQRASQCYRDFGVTNIYFKSSAKYRMSRITTNSDEQLSHQTLISDNYLNGYTQGFVNGKYGLCDVHGNYVIAPTWNRVSDYNCEIVSVMDDYGCKFLDITGRILFESNHQYAGTFYNNRCAVMDNEYCFGIIDNNGNPIVPCDFDGVWILHDGYILGMTGNEYSVIDPKGKTVCSFDDEFVGLSVDRKVLVLQDENGFVGAVRYDGEAIAKNNFDGTGGTNGNAIAMKKDGTYTVFDLNGKKLFEITADYIGEFSEGVATVTDENGVRLVDLSGNTVAEMPDDVSDVHPFKKNYAVVYYADGSFAYINKQNQIVSEKYSFASDFNGGYAIVCANENGIEKWKMIDEQFNTVHAFEGQIEFDQKDFESGYVYNSSETGESGYVTLGDKEKQKALISLEKTQITLRVEEIFIMNVVSNNNSSVLTWKSSEPSVATVDSNGNVIALSVGETVITVSDGNNNLSSCVVNVLPNKFKIIWNIDGNITEQTLKIGEEIPKPADPVKSGFKFVGWTPAVPDTMPAYDLTFTAVFEKSYICPDCGDEILGEDAINAHIAAENASKIKTTVKIKNNSGAKTINYGETLRLTAITTDMSPDAKIYWYVDGNKAGEGETFEVSPSSGSIEITVKIVDSSGKVLVNANGNEVSDSQKVTVNSGFWQKIVSFFKNLFGINRTVIQIFNVIS